MAHLQIISGKTKGLRVELGGREVTVGSEKTNVIVLDDPGVSRHHCSISLVGNQYRLRTLESAKGLIVNGHPVSEALLQHGDIATIGSSDLVYSAAEAEPVGAGPAAGPPPFVSRPPQVSLLRRILWPFTRLGRANHCLLRAYERPNEPRCLDKVAKALAKLPADKTHGKPAEERMAAELSVYLAWMTLTLGDFDRCSSVLADLDSRFPTLPARTSIRWDLLQASWKAGATKPYVQQARLFVADPGAAGASYSPAVLDVIRLLYEAVSPAECASVLKQAHPLLHKKTEVEAAQQLCACPAFFQTSKEGRDWITRIRPKDLGFSRVMKADAHLVFVRAVEAQRDWSAMVDTALEALRAAPAHKPALYWLARAKLQAAANNPAEHLGPAPKDEGNDWKRARLLIALHTQPSVADAQPVVALLSDKMGATNRGEKMLAVEVLHRALRASPPSTPEEIDLAAGICRVVEEAAGMLPWTQAMMAHKEAKVDRNYAAAYRRAEQPKVCDEPGALRTARISRVLAGSPRSPSNDSQENVLSTLESGFWRLLGRPGNGTAVPDHVLWQRLEAAEDSEESSQFPDLKPAAAVMALALRLLAGDIEPVWRAIRCIDVSASVPAWIAWLRARTFLLAWVRSEPVARIPASLIGDPAVAFAIECATGNHDRAGVLDEQAAARLDYVMKAWLSKQDDPRSKAGQWIQHSRASGYRACADSPCTAKIDSIFPELGDLPDAVCASEATLEVGYAQARCALAAGKTEDAVRRLQALIQDAARVAPLVAAYWEPLLGYWMGVAQAHAGDKQAAANLEAVAKANETKALSARGQLALLALQRGDIDGAERWIEGASLDVPSARYAKALTLARRNEGTAARRLLDSEEARSVLGDSAYAVPARRLAAAIEERAGNGQESDRLHGALLEAHPDDEVASIRLGRSILHDAYVLFVTDGTLGNGTVGNTLRNLVHKIKTNITWWSPYALLYDLMSAPDDSLPGLEKAVNSMFGRTDHSFAWRQTLAARLTLAGRPNDALRILAASRRRNVPPWFQRARLFLQTWSAVARLADEKSRDEAPKELAQCLQDFKELDASDATIIRWRTMAELGESLGTGAPSAPIARWRELAPHPMAQIPFLFDADLQLRRAAAESLMPLLSHDGVGWSDEQRQMLHTLAAWACEKDDVFLEQYDCLEPILEKLPVPERDLWAPAALIRYARADWQSLTGDRLPQCLQDMSDPLVCLILELADARATAGDLKNPNQRVADRVKGIHRNLFDLLRKLEAETTGSPKA